MRADGECAYQGIPAFPSRSFSHGAFYVRADGDIREPRDQFERGADLRQVGRSGACQGQCTVPLTKSTTPSHSLSA